MDLVRALRRRALGQEINFLEKPTQEAMCDLSAFSDLLCVLLRIIHGGLVIFVSLMIWMGALWFLWVSWSEICDLNFLVFCASLVRQAFSCSGSLQASVIPMMELVKRSRLPRVGKSHPRHLQVNHGSNVWRMSICICKCVCLTSVVLCLSMASSEYCVRLMFVFWILRAILLCTKRSAFWLLFVAWSPIMWGCAEMGSFQPRSFILPWWNWRSKVCQKSYCFVHAYISSDDIMVL